MSYYGNNWEIRVSRAKAEKYLAGKSLPAIGCKTELIVKRDDYDITCRLVAMNISGIYYIACCTVAVRDWPEFFGFTLDSVKEATK